MRWARKVAGVVRTRAGTEMLPERLAQAFLAAFANSTNSRARRVSSGQFAS